ncbi:hypothetical protein R5R35_008450 [Gryllus longicercus]|uniref:Ionotropic receptor n=1 Tax=Gryllus longicercus TaxID=2509291 RepID=A0AAN9VGX9_9ORTH
MRPLWDDMRGHPLRLSLVPRNPLVIPQKSTGNKVTYAGLDGNLYEAIKEVMNFTPVLVSPTDGLAYTRRFKNGSVTGPLKDVSNGASEVAFNHMASGVIGNINVDIILPPIYYANILFLIPKAGKIPSWNLISKIFSWKLWLTAFLFYFLSVVFLFFLGNTEGKRSKSKSTFRITQSFIEVFHYFITAPFSKMDAHETGFVQAFIASCLLLGVVLITLFQSALVDILTNPRYYPDINTAQQLLDSRLPVGTGIMEFVSALEASDSKVLQSIGKNCLSVSATTSVVWILLYKNVSTITDSLGSAVIHGLVPNVDSHLHAARETAGTFFAVHVARRGSPLSERLSALHFRAVESGLLRAWHDMMVQRIGKVGRARYRIHRQIYFAKSYEF